MSTENPGELSVVTWRSEITTGLKRERCTLHQENHRGKRRLQKMTLEL